MTKKCERCSHSYLAYGCEPGCELEDCGKSCKFTTFVPFRFNAVIGGKNYTVAALEWSADKSRLYVSVDGIEGLQLVDGKRVKLEELK